MPDYRSLIFGKAYRVVPGVEYNRVLAEILGPDAGDEAPLVYEVAVPEEGTWEYFRDRTYPTFVRYLQRKSIDPESPRGVVVAAFFQDRCYLLHGPDFVEVLSEMEGLNSAALHFRALQWLT